MFLNEYICVVTKLVTHYIDRRSRARPYDRFCRSFNVNFSYSYVFCYPIQDHMTREEADLEWRAMMDYWADVCFGNNRIEVYKTQFMGLGLLFRLFFEVVLFIY